MIFRFLPFFASLILCSIKCHIPLCVEASGHETHPSIFFWRKRNEGSVDRCVCCVARLRARILRQGRRGAEAIHPSGTRIHNFPLGPPMTLQKPHRRPSRAFWSNGVPKRGSPGCHQHCAVHVCCMEMGLFVAGPVLPHFEFLPFLCPLPLLTFQNVINPKDQNTLTP